MLHGLRRNVKPVLVVAALSTVLRGQPGRNPGDNDGTTQALVGAACPAFGLAKKDLSRHSLNEGGSVRVLAFDLCPAFHLYPAYGGQDGGQGGENGFCRRTGLFRGRRFSGGDFSMETKWGVRHLGNA